MEVAIYHALAATLLQNSLHGNVDSVYLSLDLYLLSFLFAEQAYLRIFLLHSLPKISDHNIIAPHAGAKFFRLAQAHYNANSKQ